MLETDRSEIWPLRSPGSRCRSGSEDPQGLPASGPVLSGSCGPERSVRGSRAPGCGLRRFCAGPRSGGKRGVAGEDETA